MRRLIRRAQGLSVSWKLFLCYYAIVIVPIVIFGILFYQQMIQSSVLQAKMLIEENFKLTRANIHQHVRIIEHVSQLIASNNSVRNYLSYHYDTETKRLIEYQFNVSPLIKSIVLQNQDIPRIRLYMKDMVVTEAGDSFRSLRRSFDQAQYTAAVSAMEEAVTWPGQRENYRVSISWEDDAWVFQFWSTIYSSISSSAVGVLEVQIRENTLFSMLHDPAISTLGNVYIVNDEDLIITDNAKALTGKPMEAAGLVPAVLRSAKPDETILVRGEPSMIISVPLEMVGATMIGVFPVQAFYNDFKGTLTDMITALLLVSVILGAVIYFTTNALLSRIKKLARAIRQVNDNNFKVTVQVGAEDEFGELALSFNHMTQRIHDLIETVYKIEIMEKEAEIKALEAQINPHFLYNTLATVSWAARKAKAMEIAYISNALAKFYRLVLNKGNRCITVKDEMEMVKAYLDIIRFRVGDRLTFHFEADESIFGYAMLKNILQPLVENALNHGLEPKPGRGTIVIRAGQEDGRIYFKIIDDGVGIDMRQLKQIKEGFAQGGTGSGYAIKNVMERLKAYYGSGYSFDLCSRPGIGTVVTITIEKLMA